MFGCYRRSDAADADTYVAAVAMVLAHYAAAVVQVVTDPFSGLPSRKTESGWSGLPDVADVKEACEDEAARQHRMAVYAAIGRTEFKRLPAPREERPGAWATVLVHAQDPRYAAFLERTKAETTDRRDWKQDERGLWVSYAWIDGDKAGETPRFMQYSEAELRRMYPPREPPVDSTFPVKHSQAAE
jgi:hypothetical protein